MKNNTVRPRDLLMQCCQMDQEMMAIYLLFSAETTNPEEKNFWRQSANEEKKHIVFWRQALRVQCPRTYFGTLPELEKKYLYLKETHQQLTRLYRGVQEKYNSQDKFFVAYAGEMLMMNPVFIGILRNFSIFNKKHAENYCAHTLKFIQAMVLYGNYTKETKILKYVLTNLSQMNQEIYENSIRDPLTALLNRRGFYQQGIPFLAQALFRHQKTGILMVDVDCFKKVNDQLGHPAGDQILQTIARTLLQNIRKQDLIGRYGGDEIIVLCKIKTLREACQLGERLRMAIGHLKSCPSSISVTVSIGGVTGTIPETDWSNAIKQADINLYRAKESGRNFCMITPYQERE